MEQYYLIINGTENGPFSSEELKEKGLTSSSLVWKEGMDNWTEAKNVEGLKKIVKKGPPPIPPSFAKPFQTETININIKPKKSDSGNNVIFAKEIKFIFKQILFGLIIGIISFPAFYFVIYNAPKFDNFDFSQLKDDGSSREYWVSPGLFNPISYIPGEERYAIKRRKEYFTKKSKSSALYTILIASTFLIGYRYTVKGTRWVNETAKKDIPQN